jgi:transcriptional regulator with XRE-family HTH domain
VNGDYRTRVGARIRRARLEQGLTQTELAQEVGVADAQVSRWETGRAMPQPDSLEALAQALKVKAEAFLTGPSS